MTTVVFVPGAWHRPSCFRFIIERLGTSGYATEAVDLPSHDPTEQVLGAGFWPDVEAIRNVIIGAVEKGQKVIILMHSVAGTFGPDACYELDWETRQSKGLIGGVTHLIFLAATVLRAGVSNVSAGNGDYPKWMLRSEDKLTFAVDDPLNTFYHDVPTDLATKAVADLVPQAATIFECEVVHDTWRSIPGTYIKANLDQALLPALQDYFISEVTSTGNYRVETIETGHSPFLAKPQEMTDMILRAIELSEAQTSSSN